MCARALFWLSGHGEDTLCTGGTTGGVQDAGHHRQCGTSGEAAQCQKQLRKGIKKPTIEPKAVQLNWGQRVSPAECCINSRDAGIL